MFLNKVVKASLHAIGLDLQRLRNTPSFSLCGLKNLNISTILDVGANEGQFATLARGHFPRAKVFSFEPLPEPYAKLRALAEKDRNMVAVNVALGTETGTQTFLRHTEHSPSSSFLTSTPGCHALYPQIQGQEEVTVEVSMLDAWMSGLREPLDPEILIKLDVQGYEDRVIAGGGRHLGRRPRAFWRSISIRSTRVRPISMTWHSNCASMGSRMRAISIRPMRLTVTSSISMRFSCAASVDQGDRGDAGKA